MLSGTIDLLRVRPTTSRAYELTPRQLRRLFDERGWATVLALHADALDHREGAVLPLAEFGMDRCDGFLFHHSATPDGFHDLEAIHQLAGFERTVANFYQQDNILVGAFPSSRRFGGAREALRYAICAKNYGCSHIIVGGSLGDPTGTRLLESPTWQQYENSAELGVVLAAL